MNHYLTHKQTSHGTPLREASQRDIRRHVTVNLAEWADQPIANITRDMCLSRFAEISERAPGQANQCMVNLSVMQLRRRTVRKRGRQLPHSGGQSSPADD